MKFSKLWGMVVALAIAVPVWAEGPIATQVVTAPTITAPKVGGGNVLCYGESCASIIQSMQMASYENLVATGELVDAEPAIDKTEFCHRLSMDETEQLRMEYARALDASF